jgi:hypothetical protein
MKRALMVGAYAVALSGAVFSPAVAQLLPPDEGHRLADTLPAYAQWLVLVGHTIEDARACGGIVSDSEVDGIYAAAIASSVAAFHVSNSEAARVLQIARNYARAAPVTAGQCKDATSNVPMIRKLVAPFMTAQGRP